MRKIFTLFAALMMVWSMFAATETVHFINAKKWAKVNVYAWTTDPNASWPGAAATKEAEQIAGYDVYSFTANAGQYANVIFNDGSSQTPDLVWTAGKYYVIDMGWLTKEEAETKLAAPLPETWNIVGAAGLMGKDWDLNAAENAMTKQEDGTYKLEKKGITIVAGTYEYKAAKDHGWTVSVPQDGNQKLTISKSGIYDITFVLNVTAKTLKATATLKQAAVVIPTIVIAGDMNGWNQTKDKFTMSADSLTATFKATLTAKSYGFKMIVGGSWHSDGKTITRAANSTKFTGANSSNNSTLKADIDGEYLFTWEYTTKTLTVTYPALPVKYTVTATVNPAETGTVEGAGTYEEGKTATLTATPAEGYEFVCWTEGADTVSTEAEYGFVVLADRNLVANFVEAAPEINYEEFIMSNLVVTTPAEGLEMLEASDPVNGISVMLGVYEDGTLHEDCLITFQGMELSIVSSEKVTKEYNEDVETDVYTVRVVVAFGGANMGLQLLMYATAAAEPIIINVEGATVTLTEYQISAEETAYELNMISNWVYEEDGLTYEVECLLPTFDPTKESGDYEASFFVRGEGNAFGMTEDAIVSVAKNGNQITLTGEITAYNNNVYNVTISGTLPVVEPTTITWELNGGEFPAVVVPTNEELAMAFKQEYAEYFAIEGLTDTDMNREVGNFIYVTNSKGGDAVKFITENANWKWLHDYILTVAGNIPEGTNVGYYWRANIDGFFHCKNAVLVGGVASADFTEAGKPEAWGAAYEAEYGVVLPTEPVAEDYVLPTPVKEGYTFVGWYDNAEGTGKAYTVIPAGWAGTLYAIWKQGTTTALENIAVEGKAVKAIINGQLVIIKNGVQYNAQGAIVK